MSSYPTSEKTVDGQGGQGAPPPVQQQPTPGAAPGAGAGGWLQAPAQVPPNCPPGLEYLAQVDQLLVKQKVEGLEWATGFETNNKYEVLNSLGQIVYRAVEDTCCCTRMCCGNCRPFDIKIMDNKNKEIIHLSRGLRCTSCFCPCCLQKVTVESPPGQVIGYVSQAWGCWKPRFRIENAAEETVLRMKGPCCTWDRCGDIEFDVLAADDTTYVGRVTKQWSGLAKEFFTDSDNFGISFPIDLDVSVKACMLAAVFLIDFMYFEGNEGKKKVKDVKD